jgi:cytoskeletal protein CcmA (bactofilin family)
MAFQDLRKGRDTATSMSASAGGVGTLTAFIDQGSEFTGKLSFKDTVRIDGRFEGEISSENTLIVGESGSVHASIHSEIVIISGEVHGDIFANQQITLHKNARVVGNLNTKALAVDEGAQINGTIEMGTPPSGKKLDAKPEPKGKDDKDNIVKLGS